MTDSSSLTQKGMQIMKTKRLAAGILAACLTLSLALPASAAGNAAPLEDASQAVTALGIMSGDGSGEDRKSVV